MGPGEKVIFRVHRALFRKHWVRFLIVLALIAVPPVLIAVSWGTPLRGVLAPGWRELGQEGRGTFGALISLLSDHPLRALAAPGLLPSLIGLIFLFDFWLLTRTETMSLRSRFIRHYRGFAGMTLTFVLGLIVVPALLGLLLLVSALLWRGWLWWVAALLLLPIGTVALGFLLNLLLPLLPPSNKVKLLWDALFYKEFTQIGLENVESAHADMSRGVGRAWPFGYGAITITAAGQAYIEMREVANAADRELEINEAVERLKHS